MRATPPPKNPTYDDVIAHIRAISVDAPPATKGDHFVQLVIYYLTHAPTRKNQYKKIQRITEWRHSRGELGDDQGIDLVAENTDGGVTAIQAKFYDEGTQLNRSDKIDSFIAESSKDPFTNRLLVTTSNLGKNANRIIDNQNPPCLILTADQMRQSTIDWTPFLNPKAKYKTRRNTPHPHQKKAIADTLAGLKTADRGKLIMACGTGKTYTSLQIAQQIAPENGHILFLVPSLSLLSQALHEWAEQATRPIASHIVCSDTKVGKETTDNEDISIQDLAQPATTNPKTLARNLTAKTQKQPNHLNIVFATYHSIDTIAQAQQKHNAPTYDLIICDEAHRTTGAEKLNEHNQKESSYYIKVHDNTHIKAKKRLYMTATPRIYSPDSQTKAKQQNINIYSMDDPATYGKELHRLGFAKAVDQNLLSDYKVLVLCVNESQAAAATTAPQQPSGELALEDKAKIIGCWNGLAKRFSNPDNTPLTEKEKHPMRRAVAYTTTIAKSQKIAAAFNQTLHTYNGDPTALQCTVEHIDGKMNAIQRAQALHRLRTGDPTPSEDTPPRCRILTNAKCLSEGVDVPALDAVMFMDPRKSQVDVVQTVGRVMRKAPGKQYGYVILPIVLPPDKKPEDALNSNPNAYKIVWQVLQALRAHDERFNATINKLELNKTKPQQINIIGVDTPESATREPGAEYTSGNTANPTTPATLFPDMHQWQNAILARIVQKCGDKHYWENWAADVGKIAQTNITRINAILQSADSKAQKHFHQFLTKLQKNLNPSVTQTDAIEMLSQHLITRPIFNALFESYTFADKNPVSRSMTQIIKLLDKHGLEAELTKLNDFYDSVKRRAQGIDNAEGKQKIMLELYEKFFSTAFKKQSEKLGIVYTPTEIVDFILQSADTALQKHHGRKLTDPNIHILDPFTGTGTFIARLLRPENPLINPKDLARKYQKELHANEITLLAYYIAAINIEETYHHRAKTDYQPFNGIILTDTFQLNETDTDLYQDILKENSARANKQRNTPIQVIIGNPPYSAGQNSANDDNQNQKYPHLDKRITDTYAKDSASQNKNSIYDSYIRSIRWASDRIKDEGIVAFVTNGSYIDSNAAAGVRKHLLEDFTAVYCYNLRGNQRTAGEISRREGGKVFGSGSRAPVAITLLVKTKNHTGNGTLYYHDIGDYINREEKLNIIKQHQNYANIDWQTITPNEQHDWINQRNPIFSTYPQLEKTMFISHSRGMETTRDAWVYSFSKKELATRMKQTIGFYNGQVDAYKNSNAKSAQDFVDKDPTKISWSRALIRHVEKNNKCTYDESNIRVGLYRPFCKQYIYSDSMFIDLPTVAKRYFPTPETKNLAICVTGVGASKEFSALMVDTVPDLEIVSKSQCFPLYYYEQEQTQNLIGGTTGGKQENITDSTLRNFQQTYNDPTITKQDIFHYVYGILHSPQYKQKHAADLTKMLPRIPMAKTKTTYQKYTTAGRALADLHLNYETAPEHPLAEHHKTLLTEDRSTTVEKMKHPGKQTEKDRTQIEYNPHLTLTGIPPEAHNYKVNGKTPIEWIMDRYQTTTQKETGITNNPNHWSDNNHHIISLLKKAVHISIETDKIIQSLPNLEE